MRIDAYNAISQLYQATKPRKVTQSEESVQVKDQYQISQSAKDYQVAKNALNDVPDVREDKVAEYQEALASGTYNVSSQEIADKIVSKYFDSMF